MPITNTALASATTKNGLWRHLLQLLAEDKKVAFFESKSEHKELFYAWGSDAYTFHPGWPNCTCPASTSGQWAIPFGTTHFHLPMRNASPLRRTGLCPQGVC